jgi:hypothetical protein
MEATKRPEAMSVGSMEFSALGAPTWRWSVGASCPGWATANEGERERRQRTRRLSFMSSQECEGDALGASGMVVGSAGFFVQARKSCWTTCVRSTPSQACPLRIHQRGSGLSRMRRYSICPRSPSKPMGPLAGTFMSSVSSSPLHSARAIPSRTVTTNSFQSCGL